MRRIFASLCAWLIATPAFAGPISGYPVVVPTGPETVIGTQGGVTVNMTAVNIAKTLETASPTFTTPLTITPPSGAGSASSGLNINQAFSGTALSPRGSEIAINSDTVDTGNGNLVGVNMDYSFGGSTVTGGRAGIWVNLTRTAATSASNTNRNYVGILGQDIVSAGDGGTGLTALLAKGAEFAMACAQVSHTGATNLLNTTCLEANSRMETGSSVALKSIMQFSGQPQDQVQGNVVDTMLWLYDQTGAIGHNVGILFDGTNQQWPISAGGTIFKAIGGGSATATGIDLTGVRFTGDAFQSHGFAVSDGGGIGASGIVINGGFSRPGLTTFGNLNTGDASPQVGDYAVVTDATTCVANSPVTAGSGTHVCPVIRGGSNWIAQITN